MNPQYTPHNSPLRASHAAPFEFFGEQIPQNNTSTLHNDSLREMIYNMIKYLTGDRTLQSESCHIQALTPVAAPKIIILTTHGAASDDEAGSMTPPTALNEGES